MIISENDYSFSSFNNSLTLLQATATIFNSNDNTTATAIANDYCYDPQEEYNETEYPTATQEQHNQMEHEIVASCTNNSSSTVVAVEEVAGILAPWSEHATKAFGDLMEKSDQEERIKKESSLWKNNQRDKPKPPLSAYNIFFEEERNNILLQQDAGSQAGLSRYDNDNDNDTITNKAGFESLGKLISSRWQELVDYNKNNADNGNESLSKTKMSIYKMKANIDMERYKHEMEIWDRNRMSTKTRRSGRRKKRINSGTIIIENNTNKDNNNNNISNNDGSNTNKIKRRMTCPGQ